MSSVGFRGTGGGPIGRPASIGERAETHRERIGILVQVTRDFPQYLEPHAMLGEQFMDLGFVHQHIRRF